MKYKNESLAEVVRIAHKRGYKVYGFQSDKRISQVFIEDTNGRVGTCFATFGEIKLYTVHKNIRGSGVGTGFGDGGNHHPEEIDLCFAFAPSWVGRRDLERVVKYKSFDEYLKYNTILTYFPITE
jgi:hypothetical protein